MKSVVKKLCAMVLVGVIIVGIGWVFRSYLLFWLVSAGLFFSRSLSGIAVSWVQVIVLVAGTISIVVLWRRKWEGKWLMYLIQLSVIVFILEFVSKKILINKGLLQPNGIIQLQAYGNKLSGWQGGYDIADEARFRGYNDSLVLGNWVQSNQYGISGDSIPIRKEKALNTIRVVLRGGSGLYGNLQTKSIVDMFNYPQGIYDYQTSIAGKLKKNLVSKYPSIHWEVINAGVCGHTFSQSFAGYPEKIHDLNPDVIINMDGYNDNGLAADFTTKGDPYVKVQGQMTQGVALEILKRASRFGYTYMLITGALLSGEVENNSGAFEIVKFLEILKQKRVQISDIIRIAQESTRPIPSFPVVRDSFKLIDPFMRKNIAKQLWLFESYENQLEHDSVFSIFCFQPILAREGMQKQLSYREVTMRDFLNEDAPQVMVTDSVAMSLQEELEPGLQDAFKKSGNATCYIKKYYNKYFINDYLSPVTDSLVRSHGGVYIDIGEKMRILPPTFEAYMDYTHTTPAMNQFIADQMTQGVDVFMKRKSR